MERITREHLSKVECIPGCANCCPKDCRHLTKDYLCNVHPKKLGVSVVEALDYGRGMGCYKTPFDLFLLGGYCPAITKILEERGVVVQHKADMRGMEVIVNFREVMKQTREISDI